MTELYGTFIGRWYVTAFGITFLWRASRHLGWRKTLTYGALALGIGILAENGSVHFGFPYTSYVFDPALRKKEIFVGSVPLMVPLSYTFLGYFGFAAGRIVSSGPNHTRARRVWQEVLLGIVLTVWALWIIDPVSRLGDRWFLGSVFHYRGPGFWFGLPLGSQLGFTLTAAVLVAILTYMTRHETDQPVAHWRDHPHLIALITYNAEVAWLATVAFILGADEIGGAAALIWIPAAILTAINWSNLRALTHAQVPPVAEAQPTRGRST